MSKLTPQPAESIHRLIHDSQFQKCELSLPVHDSGYTLSRVKAPSAFYASTHRSPVLVYPVSSFCTANRRGISHAGFAGVVAFLSSRGFNPRVFTIFAQIRENLTSSDF
jgi:hypothetical protein